MLLSLCLWAGLAAGSADAADSEGPAIPPVVGSPVPAPAASEDYVGALETFRRYAASKQVRAPEDLPFVLEHGHQTENVVLMAHGLSDSPYYMRTLAEQFYGAGYNVVCLLLPGHGTRPEDLLKVKLSQWQSEVRFGLEVSRRLGAAVSLAGFSTGAALELDALRADSHSSDPIPFKDLFLFSPAIKIANAKAARYCLPGARQIIEREHPWASGDPAAAEDDPFKYRKLALNAVCELEHLTRENSLHRGAILKAIKAQGLGVFAVESRADQTIAPESVIAFMRSLPKETRRDFILYPEEEAIAHAAVTRPETNPLYSELEDRLAAFLAPPVPEAAKASVFSRPPDGRLLQSLLRSSAF